MSHRSRALNVLSDTMKLTALFTARQGRNFLHTLSSREARNYQFEFLQPSHSLFGYFNRLVEQYTRVLYPDKEMLEQLKNQTREESRWTTLEIARRHAKWEKSKREKEKKRHDDQEAERCTHRPFYTLTQRLTAPIQWRLLRLIGTTMLLFKLSSSLPLTRRQSFLHL